MHKLIYQEFERICSRFEIKGSVLEVGAIPTDKSLLCMKSIRDAKEKIGINLNEPSQYKDFKILQGNANDMSIFEDGKFDAVLCNATLEHDIFFWKTISEIHRVTKSGGLIIMGVPGFKHFKIDNLKSKLIKKRFFRKLGANKYLNLLFTATITFQIHAAPSDYYRFSIQSMKDFLLKDLENTTVFSIMLPPRLIGFGIKK